MTNFTQKTLAVLFAAALSSSMWAGTPFKSVTLSKAAPARVEAEDFDKDGDGVSFHWNVDRTDKNIADYRKADDPTAAVFASGGSNGHHIGELDGGVFTVYTVNVADAGSYKIVMACSKDNDQPRDYKFTLVGTDVETSGVFSDDAHGWENFASKINAQIDFPAAGTYEIKFETGGGYNIDYFDFAYAADYGQGMEIPGTLDLLKWDLGGDGISFHWAAMTNEGRPSPKGDGDELGHTSGGDWVNYTVNVAQAGYYDMIPGISCGLDSNMEFTLTDAETGKNLSPYITFSFESNHSWGNYDDFGATPQAVYLPEGQITIRMTFISGFNAKYLTFAYSADQSAPDVNYGQGMVVPGRVELLKYDLGGLGTSYYWAREEAGTRPSPKGDGDELGHSSQGDWLNYTVTVAEAGYYNMKPGVTNGSDHRTVFELNNAKTGESLLTCTVDADYGAKVVNLPSNGSWGNYDDEPFINDAVLLPAGEVTMQFKFREEFNARFLEFVKSETSNIQNVNASTEGKWYNLQGIEVAAPSKGIFIHNGKKVVF